MKFKLLRQFKDKAKNPNAIKLLNEIEKLLDVGNEDRADVLLKRYKKRYANIESVSSFLNNRI